MSASTELVPVVHEALLVEEPANPSTALGHVLPTTGLAPEPVSNYLAQLSKDWRSTMARVLRRLARAIGFEDPRAIPWASWTNQEMAAVRAYAATLKSPSSGNLVLSATRGVIHACWRLNLLTSDQRDRICEVKPFKGTRLRRGKMLTVANIDAMLRATVQGPRGVRDRAILALIYGVGLRIHEPSRVMLSDWEPDTGRLIIRGKGDREREVFLTAGTLAHVQAWLSVRGTTPGPLFPSAHKARSEKYDAYRKEATPLTAEERMRAQFDFTRPLTRSSTAKMVMRLAQAANVQMTTHDLRRSFISTMLINGVDALLVARIVGHRDPSTTLKYDMRGSDQIAQALQGFYVPVSPPPTKG